PSMSKRELQASKRRRRGKRAQQSASHHKAKEQEDFVLQQLVLVLRKELDRFKGAYFGALRLSIKDIEELISELRNEREKPKKKAKVNLNDASNSKAARALQECLQSTSWQLTAPLRALGNRTPRMAKLGRRMASPVLSLAGSNAPINAKKFPKSN